MYKAYSYNRVTADKYDFAMNRKIPLNEKEGGILYKTFLRKKPVYLHRIPKLAFEIEKEIAETLSVKAFLYVPLTRKKECIVILGFSNLDDPMKLSKNEIRKISNLCSQIAGAIGTNHLLQKVEKAKLEMERIAEAMKMVNESGSLSYIVQALILYLEEEFNFDTTWLLLVDENSNSLHTHAIVGDMEIEKLIYLKKLKIPLNKESGIFYSTYIEKKIFYINGIPKNLSNLDSEIMDSYGGKFILQVPLVIQDRTIGILNLTSSKEILHLSHSDLSKLQLFTDQIAGAVNNAYLSQKTSEAKDQAEIEKGIAQVAQKEAEDERGK